ncbi:MAG: FAD-dependent oxidoreductase [Clostridia bacterium]|nr:FAD-dependent oxidoreductase [Clostridia bacterium]
MHKSVWETGMEMPKFESLTKNEKTDVLIIGGGLCGILCAYYLQNAGVDYILVEGQHILSGITKNTTAKITSQHGLIYSKIIKSYGKELAQMYLTANQNAVEQYAKLCSSKDCDFERKAAYTYSVTDSSKIEREIKAVNSLGLDADFADTAELPFETRGAIRFANQAQFNPLKFAAHIAHGLNIYENTYVYELSPTAAHTRSSTIKANKFIVATHFPFVNKHGSYFLKLYQHRSYVAAYSNAPTLQGMYVDDDKKGMSFRAYKDLLFIGGSGHRTGKQSDAWSALHSHADKYYPHAQLKYEWAAQDCMSLDGIPYIGQYSKSTPNLYVASGFNKWGITSSMAAAQILADMVRGVKNDCAEVFSPQRSILKPQLAVNGIETTMNLLTPTAKRCPHLGCALKWNKAEHTWDCPCHGSRFEQNGRLIDNPAKMDAR